MNFVKPLCDKLRWFKPPLPGAGPVVPAGSRNHLTGINCCDWWAFGLCLGWGMDGAEAFGALPRVFTSSTIYTSSFLPPSLCSHCKRVTLSALSSLFEVKIRQINQAPNKPALRRPLVSALEGGEGALTAQWDLLEAPQFSCVFTWKTLSLSQDGWASGASQIHEYEICHSLAEIQALFYSMAKLPMTSAHQV